MSGSNMWSLKGVSSQSCPPCLFPRSKNPLVSVRHLDRLCQTTILMEKRILHDSQRIWLIKWLVFMRYCRKWLKKFWTYISGQVARASKLAYDNPNTQDTVDICFFVWIKFYIELLYVKRILSAYHSFLM